MFYRRCFVFFFVHYLVKFCIGIIQTSKYLVRNVLKFKFLMIYTVYREKIYRVSFHFYFHLYFNVIFCIQCQYQASNYTNKNHLSFYSVQISIFGIKTSVNDIVKCVFEMYFGGSGGGG